MSSSKEKTHPLYNTVASSVEFLKTMKPSLPEDEWQNALKTQSECLQKAIVQTSDLTAGESFQILKIMNADCLPYEWVSALSRAINGRTNKVDKPSDQNAKTQKCFLIHEMYPQHIWDVLLNEHNPNKKLLHILDFNDKCLGLTNPCEYTQMYLVCIMLASKYKNNEFPNVCELCAECSMLMTNLKKSLSASRIRAYRQHHRHLGVIKDYGSIKSFKEAHPEIYATAYRDCWWNKGDVVVDGTIKFILRDTQDNMISDGCQ